MAAFRDHALLLEHDLFRKPASTPAFARAGFFGIMLYYWSMIFSENRHPLFGIMLRAAFFSAAC
jgi:hypothetical protein